jgi:hypothetical protein
MFPLDARKALSTILGHERWSFLGSVSFEPRWRGASDFMREAGVSPCDSCFLFPIDKGSRWEKECRDLQENAWKAFLAECRWSCTRIDVDLLESPAWETAVKALQGLVGQKRQDGPQRLIVDMSTMPKLCLYPVIKSALEMEDLESLVVLYTEPLNYFDGPLHSEPTGTPIIPGFDYLGGDRDRPTGWMPILGFSGFFAAAVYDNLAETYRLEDRVFPIIGFPAFDPSFFERAFREGFSSILRSHPSIASQFVYAAASDPFETRNEIVRLVESTGGDVQWIGSPLGAKPMGLGMLLASLEKDITIVTCQVRTYHPKYSDGVGRIWAYVIKAAGRKCF